MTKMANFIGKQPGVKTIPWSRSLFMSEFTLTNENG